MTTAAGETARSTAVRAEPELAPARGAPPEPEGWLDRMHRGPAVEEGCVPQYLLRDPAPTPAASASGGLEVIRVGGDVHETCDLAVIGSGAGGAALAATASEAGLRVVVLEEGDLFTKADFTGSPLDRILRLYRDGGATGAIGSPAIQIPVGKTVGGTTTVNSGTCFRAPRGVLDSWFGEFGVEGFDYDSLDTYYRRVESSLSVRPSPWKLIGPTGWIADAGARALGLTGGPILRNISSCHGSGQCAFGCPTDAKQAMHLSYLPRAQHAGARIYARARAEWLEVEGGRAAGVRATLLDAAGARSGRLRVTASTTAVACGALHTPIFLSRNGLGARSHRLGRNLSIHPAGAVAAWFEYPVFGWRGMLQPYYIDSLFRSHGALLEATAAAPSIAAGSLGGFGAQAKERIASLAHVATLGLLVSDTSRGRVRRGPQGRPWITYRIGDRDARSMYEGLALAAEVMLAAGAIEVLPAVSGATEIRDEEGLELLRRRRDPGSLKLSAYHPMGTAHMGADASRSVVDSHLESHELRGLHVVDASVIPSCLGVNPQMTIMAIALKAGDEIARRLA